MTNQRGFTLLELLVAILAGGIVLMGLLSLYLMTTTSFAQSTSQSLVQRQGTLALEEIARQVRQASTIDTACAGLLRVVNANGTFCYYAGTGANNAPAGALCQALNGGACRNLLAGSRTDLVLIQQPAAADPRCPPVAAGQFCLAMAPVGASADVAFAISDGLNVMAFTVNLMQRN